MNRLELYQLEHLVNSIASRVQLLLSDCCDSDHRKIGTPELHEARLLEHLASLETWIADRRHGKKP